MKNQFPTELITFATERFNVTRKSAVRKLSKMTSSQLASFKAESAPTKAAPVAAAPKTANPLPVTLATATPVTSRNAAIALNQEKALKPEVAADYKTRAANDDTNAPAQAAAQTATKAPEATTKKAATPKPPVPSTPAGDARKEGIRLFQLAGKPTKQDFTHVYGEMGAKWTWVARAKAVGLNTAEEAAAEFQKMLAKAAGSCVVATEEEPKGKK